MPPPPETLILPNSPTFYIYAFVLCVSWGYLNELGRETIEAQVTCQ